jgi:MFS family permease
MPALRAADRPQHGKQVFVGAVALLAIAELVLALADHALARIVAGLVLFFTAFNLLEATLPSLVSKFAPPALKGTAVGIYSSVQFLGTFAGAAVGGALAQHAGPASVFAFGIALTLVWLVASLSMPAPPTYRSHPSIGES